MKKTGMMRVILVEQESIMAGVSKNARIGSGTHKFVHAEDGGEIKMKSIFQNGRMKHVAECEKCKRQERRPSDFILE